MNKYIPTQILPTIYDIDFQKLYQNGKSIIFTDIDNTLIPYTKKNFDIRLIQLFKELHNMGYIIISVTNNSNKRLLPFLQEGYFDDYLARANKPYCRKLQQFMKTNRIDTSTVLFIGDQILTDIACGNKIGLDTVLVKSIDRKSEHWYTKINRLREFYVMRNIKKIDQEKWQQITDLYSVDGKYE